MKCIQVITVICALAMGGALVYGFGFGEGWSEVRELVGYPWFVVSLIDVYVGFILFACWIAVRERVLAAVIWILLLMTLGNIIACGYVFHAIRSSKSLPLPKES